MKKILYLILFITSTQISFAQECKLKGAVADENGIPVTDASVSVFDSKNEGKGFVFTSNIGEFEFKLPCGEKYDIEIEQPGFDTYIENIDLTENTTRKLKLKKGKEISLKETIVKAQQAIKVKGDTIEFDADSFKVGNEEVLEDILKKLPGIEVQNGKVLYKGKEMKQVTVGGREVLGGNEKLLNKNLPSDAVSKIQLNTKFKSNPFASSLQEDDEQFSLNIELKEDMKRLAFGNVTLGGDTDQHTDAQAKVFYFSEKTDATLINDFNTFGKQVFDQDDYVSFFGGYSEFNAEGSIYSLRGNSNNLNLMSKNDAPSMNTYNGAVHFGVEPNKKLKVSGFGLINTNNIRYDSRSERFYNNIETPYTTVDEERNKSNVLMGMSRLRLDYSPNDKGQIKYRLNFNYLDSENEQLVDSYYNDQKNSFRNVNSDQKNYSLAQTLSYIRKVGRDDNVGLYFRHQYQKDTPDYNILSTANPFSSFDMFKNLSQVDNQYNLNQNQNYVLNTVQFYGIYNHLLTNTANLKLKAGTSFSTQDFDNSIYDFNTLLNNNALISNTGLNYNETFVDATLTKKIGNFQLDAGAGVSFFSEKSSYQDGEKIKRNETKVLPHVNLQYKFNNATSIRASYTQDYSYPYTKEFNDSYTIQSYQSIFYGNRDLKQALTHNASLNFNHFNSFSFFHVFANVTYSLRKNSIQTQSVLNRDFIISANDTIVNTYQFNTMINSDDDQETYSGYFMIGKRFTKWYNIRFTGNISTSNYYTITRNIEYRNGTVINDEINNVNNKSFTQTYNLENAFTFKKVFELKAGLNLNLSKYQSLAEQKFANWRPYGDAAWSVTDKLLVQTDFSYRLQYRDGEELNTAKEWNASARYNIARKTYLTLTGGNLLGNNIIVSNGFSDNYISTTTKNVLGRYFIVSLRYKF
ncbi:TonB-dependent receptor [Empedobacter brevis]|uniref:TonB-dependent receptor n=1 Tax=Empedobacter brevis TaxID=247 RepID=UPI002898A4CE|nr:TonB-dependent receptor [Empedobacter brevis]